MQVGVFPVEGRIQAIEARLRTAVVAAAPSGERVDLGSVVMPFQS